MEFKDRVYNSRKQINKTLEEVAKEVGVSAATISRYESGEIENIRRDKIAKLARALDVTPAYLMGWEEDTAESEEETPDKVKILAREAGDLSDVQIDLLRSMIQQFKEGKR